jgi:sortase system peptidoglycan-associated protein
MKTIAKNSCSNNANIAFNKSTFIKTSLAFALTSFLSVSAFSSAAQETEYEELKLNKDTVNATHAFGLGGGIILGAAIAGPVGAGVAGLLGLFIADDINDEAHLMQAEKDLSRSHQELAKLQRDYQHSISLANQQIAAIDSAMTDEIDKISPPLEANIQFKTASFLIEEHYKSQLNGLASQLRKNPGLKIELSGFADQRGESTYNQVLSEQRAKAVKNYLISQFVNEEQVLTQSFGESELVSDTSDFEDDFFDRRVNLKVSVKSAQMTVATK